MARTPLWMAGETVHTSAVTSGDEGMQQWSGTDTAWTSRDTSIKAGSYSAASLKKSHAALGVQAAIIPTGKSGGALTGTNNQLGATFACYFSTVTLSTWLAFGWTKQTTPASSNPFYLSLGTAGEVEIRQEDGTVMATTAAGAVSATTWTYLRWTVEYDSGASTHRWRVWKWSSTDPANGSWGSPILDYTQGSITTAFTYLTFVSVDDPFFPFGLGSTVDHYYDDIYYFSFTADADLPVAPAMVYRLIPESGAGGNKNDYTAGSGSNPNGTNVDENEFDGATTYDETPTTTNATEQQLYTLPACPSVAGYTIEAVQANGTILGVGAGSGSPIFFQSRLFVRENSTNTGSGTNFYPTSAYQTACWIMPTTPSSAAAWTTTLIDGMEAGWTKGGQATRTVRVTTMSVLIAVIPPLAATVLQQPALMGMSGGII